MSEIIEGNTIVGVPEELDKKFEREEFDCHRCGLSVILVSKKEYPDFDSKAPFNSLYPVVDIRYVQKGIYEINFHKEGSKLDIMKFSEHLCIIPPHVKRYRIDSEKYSLK